MLNENYWTCNGCGTNYDYNSGEFMAVCRDVSSFESTYTEYLCETNCKDSWWMG
jgi:hypothetical protein